MEKWDRRESKAWHEKVVTMLCGLISIGIVSLISMVVSQGRDLSAVNVHIATMRADVDALKTRFLIRQSERAPSQGDIQAQAVSDTSPAPWSLFEVGRFDGRNQLLHRDKAKQWMLSPPMIGHPVDAGHRSSYLLRMSNPAIRACAECTRRHTKAMPRAGTSMALTPSRSSNALAWCGGRRTGLAIRIQV